MGDSGVSCDMSDGDEDRELLADEGLRKGSSLTWSLRDESDETAVDAGEVDRTCRGSGEGGGVNMVEGERRQAGIGGEGAWGERNDRCRCGGRGRRRPSAGCAGGSEDDAGAR